MSTHACVDCGTELTRPAGTRGAWPSRCPPCREMRRKEVSRRHVQRYRTPYGSKAATCTDCGKTVWLGRGSRPTPTCQECRRQRRADAQPESSECIVCGSHFQPIWNKQAKRWTKACSRECGRTIGTEVLLPRPCDFCGEQFKPRRSKIRFCSQPCYYNSLLPPGSKARTYPRHEGTGRARCERGLPQHEVTIPLKPCRECGTTFLPRRRSSKSCGEACRDAWNRRQAVQSIMKRYYADPEYRDLVISRAQNRRADKLGIPGITTPAAVITHLAERDRGICGICLWPVTEPRGEQGPSMDHVIPLSWGGMHALENLQLAHLACNRSKHDKLPAPAWPPPSPSLADEGGEREPVAAR